MEQSKVDAVYASMRNLLGEVPGWSGLLDAQQASMESSARKRAQDLVRYLDELSVEVKVETTGEDRGSACRGEVEQWSYSSKRGRLRLVLGAKVDGGEFPAGLREQAQVDFQVVGE